MTIRASTDGGTTWRPVHTVNGLPAAYSDLVRVDADTVGLLFETGDFGPYERIPFRRVPVTAAHLIAQWPRGHGRKVGP